MVLGKMAGYMQKSETRPLSFTLFEIQLWIDQRASLKIWNVETSAGKK
jgi:hypothetical protein